MNSPAASPSARYHALLDLLRTAESIWNASRTFFAQWDISPSQFNILNLLRDQPEGLSQTDLSRELITHRSNVTGLVDRLEARKLVERRASATDRRAWRVVLTQEGHHLLGEILPLYYEVAEAVWGDIPAARALDLISDLKQLGEHALLLAGKHASGTL